MGPDLGTTTTGWRPGSGRARAQGAGAGRSRKGGRAFTASRPTPRPGPRRLLQSTGRVLPGPALLDGPEEEEEDGASHIFFEPSLYHCLENCGSVLLSVACQGGEGNSTFYVDYRTEDGSAKAGSDYEYRPGGWEREKGAGRGACTPGSLNRLRPSPAVGPQVWEALLTLVFFPVCVVFAWMADKRLLFYKYVYKRYRADPRSGVIIGAEGDYPKGIEMDGTFVGPDHHRVEAGIGPGPSPEDRELDESRKEVIQILKDLKQKHPDKGLDQLVGMANYYALLHQQKSRAFYRIQATRLMTGAGNVLRKHVADASRKPALLDGPEEEEEDGASHIFFEPSLYHCLENCGSVLLSVACQGGEGNSTFYVDYRTEDGSAKAGSDYEYSEGTLVFKPGETQKELRIGIIDDDIFEEDEHFFVRLMNLRVGDAQGMFEPDGGGRPKGRLVSPALATVTILDDDHAGIFTFQDRRLHVSECMGTVDVRVIRSSGARGTVRLPYRTVEGTARGGGVHYEDACGELEFGDDETM
ncbi:sodium/calcium exchanger 2 [Sarcophilus harrisii]|uniref:sodium/calcium exchanger 2 n=1 Tax=Sarcophilus harrisii TaxID=9305 RepID=UPI001301DA72|nr:sodium/calcium exchanger 2 [Sarcophilus harrisii]